MLRRPRQTQMSPVHGLTFMSIVGSASSGTSPRKAHSKEEGCRKLELGVYEEGCRKPVLGVCEEGCGKPVFGVCKEGCGKPVLGVCEEGCRKPVLGVCEESYVVNEPMFGVWSPLTLTWKTVPRLPRSDVNPKTVVR